MKEALEDMNNIMSIDFNIISNDMSLDEEINIAHMSDVHFGIVRHKELINDIASKLKELENTCDVAIISGDLADGSSVVEEDDFASLKDVKMPIIFTPGNHDFYIGIENVIKAAKKAGIIVEVTGQGKGKYILNNRL